MNSLWSSPLPWAPHPLPVRGRPPPTHSWLPWLNSGHYCPAASGPREVGTGVVPLPADSCLSPDSGPVGCPAIRPTRRKSKVQEKLEVTACLLCVCFMWQPPFWSKNRSLIRVCRWRLLLLRAREWWNGGWAQNTTDALIRLLPITLTLWYI